MNTLHRLAGVQGTSDSSPQPPMPVTQTHTVLRPPPIPQDNADDTDAHSQRRASLPLNRRPSHKSLRSHHSRTSIASRRASHDPSEAVGVPADYPPTPNRAWRHGVVDHAQPVLPRTSGETSDEEDEEFAWGPTHPCFPHPNPHCAPNSEEHANTRVIRVKRDWLAAGDLYPQFANLYPEILDPLITDSEFRNLISTLNALLAQTFSPYTTRAWVDSLVGAFTGYLSEDMGLTGVKKGEKEVEQFIERWNADRRREGRNVKLIQGRRTGFMSLDFVVPDPGIDMPVEAGEEDDNERDSRNLPIASREQERTGLAH